MRLDQLVRANAVPASYVDGLETALAEAASRLEGGARDKKLAARMKSLAAGAMKGEGDPVTSKRKLALAETLNGIAARLR